MCTIDHTTGHVYACAQVLRDWAAQDPRKAEEPPHTHTNRDILCMCSGLTPHPRGVDCITYW